MSLEMTKKDVRRVMEIVAGEVDENGDCMITIEHLADELDVSPVRARVMADTLIDQMEYLTRDSLGRYHLDRDGREYIIERNLDE